MAWLLILGGLAYVLACPSGEVDLDRDWNDRLRTHEADVRIGPPLQPDWANIPDGTSCWSQASPEQ